jgi:hypothetical protein
VTPDVVWEGESLHDFDPKNTQDVALEASMNQLQRSPATGSTPCHA